MEIVKTKEKGTKTERFMFPVSKEQKDFMKAHKEINWAATMRKALDDVIAQIQKPKK